MAPSTHARCAASASSWPYEPVGDDLRTRLFFQHHHVTVTVDAKFGELDEGHINARLQKILTLQ